MASVTAVAAVKARELVAVAALGRRRGGAGDARRRAARAPRRAGGRRRPRGRRVGAARSRSSRPATPAGSPACAATRAGRRTTRSARTRCCSRCRTRRCWPRSGGRCCDPLEEHDARRRSRLVETLDRFLSSGCRWQETATALHVHVNTLRHRLEPGRAADGPRPGLDGGPGRPLHRAALPPVNAYGPGPFPIPRHRPGVERLWRACAAAGDLELRDYEGFYCARLRGVRDRRPTWWPACARSTVSRPRRSTERNWFFRLSRYREPLRDAIEIGRSARSSPQQRRNEVLACIASGLSDFSASRPRDRARGWGIPVPDDPRQVDVRLVRRALPTTSPHSGTANDGGVPTTGGVMRTSGCT